MAGRRCGIKAMVMFVIFKTFNDRGFVVHVSFL